MTLYVIKYLDHSIHDTAFSDIVQIEDWAKANWKESAVCLKIDTSKEFGGIYAKRERVGDGEEKLVARIYTLRTF